VAIVSMRSLRFPVEGGFLYGTLTNILVSLYFPKLNLLIQRQTACSQVDVMRRGADIALDVCDRHCTVAPRAPIAG
jgi:hypothetical protein